jgi:hypothetical protein
MKKHILGLLLLAVFVAGWQVRLAAQTVADRRAERREDRADVRATRREDRAAVRAVRRSTLVLAPGFPIARAVGLAVVVHTVGTPVVVSAAPVFLPTMVWGAALVALPQPEGLAWQGSDYLEATDGWVDSNFSVDRRGDELFLDLSGQAQLDFAEVTFASGQVQVVDFQNRIYGSGVYDLLDSIDGRRVSTVRIVANSITDPTRLTVYLR